MHILGKGKWIYFDFKCSAGEQRCQVRAEKKSVRTCDVNIIHLGSVQIVYTQFKVITHLNFVDQNEIILTLCIIAFDIFIECLVFFKVIILRQIEIDMNNISGWNIFLHISFESFQQLRFTRTSYTRQHFNVGSSDNAYHFI